MPAGRPFVEAPPPRAVEPCDPKTIAPLNSDGFPDLMNYMPSRLVPLDEAKQRGWPLFYEAGECRYGHQAPRYVSNPRQCVDCHRIKRGKQPISAQVKGGAPEYKPPRAYKQREAPVVSAAPAVVPQPLEPDRQEKRFLTAYAELKDFDNAARSIGLTEAHMIARLSWSAVFRDAVTALEESLGVSRTPAIQGPFEWDADKHFRFLEVFVDTGNEAIARDSIRVTPSEFFRELDRNPDFATRFEAALPLARKALEERAIQLSLAGNDKLLPRVLSANNPQYRESVKVDLTSEVRLSDEQLRAEILRLATTGRRRVIEGEFREVEPQRAIEAPSGGEGSDAAGQSESNSDLL
jgi:hypothetical protein